MRKLLDGEIVIASNNPAKIIELAKLIKPYNYKCRSMKSLNIDSPEENGISFNQNAEIKALYTSNLSQLPSIADDSGLTIDALKGAPGIYSKRWADENGFDGAMLAIEELLLDNFAKPEFIATAHFICALAVAWPDGHSETFVGRVSGRLTFPKRGNNGFGYDPIFIPNGYNQTFAELPNKVKKTISHRSDAFNKLKKHMLINH